MRYRIHIKYSPEDEGYVATVPELPGCSAFGASIEDAVREIQTVAKAWVQTARELHREVPEPSTERNFSGKLILRMPPELHRALDESATDADVSLNQYLVFLLARAAGRYEATKITADLGELSARARRQARKAGMKRNDVKAAIAAVRRRK